MNRNFLIGSDPEVFLRSSNGNLVSAIPIISNGKRDPLKTTHGFIQHDNILAEFNSLPASSSDEFVSNHYNILNDLDSYISDMGLLIDISPSYFINPELLSDPESLVSGCDPDFNAWDKGRPNPMQDLMNTNLRVAGGHLHISIDNIKSMSERIQVVKSLDLILGVKSVVNDPSQEARDRKTLYGKAGAFRPKFVAKNDPYDGLEYRTLSNYWLRSEEFMREIYSGVQLVVNEYKSLSKLADSFKDEIINIINNNDLLGAENFMKSNREVYSA